VVANVDEDIDQVVFEYAAFFVGEVGAGARVFIVAGKLVNNAEIIGSVAEEH